MSILPIFLPYRFKRLIDCTGFYDVSAIFQPYNGGDNWLIFLRFPTDLHEPTLHRNQVKRSFAWQGGCYPWPGSDRRQLESPTVSLAIYIFIMYVWFLNFFYFLSNIFSKFYAKASDYRAIDKRQHLTSQIPKIYLWTLKIFMLWPYFYRVVSYMKTLCKVESIVKVKI